jgi:hypothetical protein
MRHEDGALSLGPEPLTRRFSILVLYASAPSRRRASPNALSN